MPRTHLRNVLRWSGRLGIVAAVAHGLGTVGVAYAVAHAPNGGTPPAASDPCPAELAGRGTTESAQFAVGADPNTLSTWLVEPRGAVQGTIVVLHGVRLDKRSMVPVAETLVDAGYRVVLVDLRGHGHSAGRYLSYGIREARDISGLLDALEARGIQLGPVGLHGFSYGAATALEVAALDSRVRAVVSVSSFSSLRVVARDYVRWQLPALQPAVPDVWLDSAVDLGARWAGFDADAAAPAAAAARSHAPLLIIHGSDDPQVSVESARSIDRAAAGYAQLMLLPGETHASVLADASGRVRSAARSWFDRHLKEAR
ncbi:MAG: alpha/beta fold hydrolase [Myxococcales bacterium]|nr:alpha/beta fold hydrolase [Myxococcales bacterium]